MQTETIEEEYLLHYTDGTDKTGIMTTKGNPSNMLFHEGQTRKVFKVERREVRVTRTVLKTEDISAKYERDMSMWDYRFTRLHLPNTDTLYFSNSAKAKEVFQSMVAQREQVSMDALVNIYLIPKFLSHAESVKHLVEEEWGSTCNTFLLDSETHVIVPDKCALSIVVIDCDELIPGVVEMLSSKSDLFYIILSTHDSVKAIYCNEAFGWKQYVSPRVRLSLYPGDVSTERLSQILNEYVECNINARHLIPKKRDL